MTREAMMEIIESHNSVVNFVNTLPDIKIPAEAVLALMPLACKNVTLASKITHEARAMGINVKYNGQSGEILYSI